MQAMGKLLLLISIAGMIYLRHRIGESKPTTVQILLGIALATMGIVGLLLW
jgi:hypothetical protein